jgi:hypothetical protein
LRAPSPRRSACNRRHRRLLQHRRNDRRNDRRNNRRRNWRNDLLFHPPFWDCNFCYTLNNRLRSWRHCIRNRTRLMTLQRRTLIGALLR